MQQVRTWRTPADITERLVIKLKFGGEKRWRKKKKVWPYLLWTALGWSPSFQGHIEAVCYILQRWIFIFAKQIRPTSPYLFTLPTQCTRTLFLLPVFLEITVPKKHTINDALVSCSTIVQRLIFTRKLWKMSVASDTGEKWPLQAMRPRLRKKIIIKKNQEIRFWNPRKSEQNIMAWLTTTDLKIV